MASYRVAHVFTVPGLLSLARVPLGLLFPFVVDRPLVAFGVLVVSGLTDILDGWWARTYGPVTVTGAVLDPVTDKLFVFAVVGTLVATGRIPPLAILLLGTREIGELPLVLYIASSRSARLRRASEPRANVPGKVATVLQFCCVALAILGSPALGPALWVAAGAGALAGISYWARTLRERRGVSA